MKEKIIVKDLVKKFGENTVLNNINTTINEGDVVCIIGPSGSGKSTFLRCLNRLEETTSGSILISGDDLTAEKTNLNQIRQHIGKMTSISTGRRWEWCFNTLISSHIYRF